MQVVVRVRPMNEQEKTRRYFQCVFPLDKKRLLLVDPEKYEKNILRANRQHERQFGFDAAFGPNSTQEDVHEATTAHLIESVVQGYNATIFAYGATGSGKTFTMIGTKEQPGLMSLLTRSLYDKIDEETDTVQLSYLEVYNEVIRDLLNPSAGILELMEDEKGNVRVPGLSSVRAPNMNRIMQILQEGNLRRTQEATEANKTSSRSHALLQVNLLRNNRQHGKLFLIDLAGSERASNTNNTGQRLKEGAAINRSLLALGNVINSLSSGNKTRYVNYRDSKLTRLLKDSLGGNARTCMIAHVTAASGHYEETYNTLVYASRAKNITTRPTQNRPSSADAGYAEALREMRKEVDRRSGAISNSMNQLSENNRRNGSDRLKNGVISTTPKKDGARGSSLFTQLKEQYMTLSDKQKKLRQRLMRANQESYEVSMGRTSKIAILMAWEKQKHIEEKTAQSIERLKADVSELEERAEALVDTRRKTEKSIRKNTELMKGLENRLRGQALSKEQTELVDLIVRMSEIEAEKISVRNDLALHDIIMKKTDNSMAKLHKYENLAERLIEGNVEESDRLQLEQEYRIVKNQFHYHLIPLKNIQSTVSWNTELLPSIASPVSSKMSSTDFPLDQTFVLNKKKKQRDSVPLLPTLQRYHSQDLETMSDVDLDSPTSHHLPPLNAF
ncbi:hypothetical protein PENTCL1PPCAC_29880 [Pristionchus entomophagus]|uniref:Kinesin-like protein n=1 Tax=Pristionchus entomophagus TaxID=358040 RepID=A0AAV5UKT6_9BILA|nr:hypothetical protein PENTCL1PPCAC_29880 [Pristionchus entomophagus]